jgi:P27 family predicted phage terminase small subunit
MEGNRGKKAWNRAEPIPPEGTPDCPEHLSDEAKAEWHRLVDTLVDMGVISIVDRAVLAAYCQAYGRWVEAEEKLKETPLLFKTSSGYVQQSPWLNIANRQMELMGRYMAEIGLTPASRSRVTARNTAPSTTKATPVWLRRKLAPQTGLKAPKTDGSSAICQRPRPARVRNHATQIGPKSAATPAVPRRCTMKRATRIPSVIGRT